SPAALGRLAVVAFGNGVLLALVALAQFFSSPRDTVYWAFPSQGQVFGPFICRNHFATYANLCLGLGLGLLLSQAYRSAGRRPSQRRLLQNPATVWIGGGLVLLLGAVALSLSRGGALALLGALVVCLVLSLSRGPRSTGLGAAVLFGGL